ncbi:hypothetical protein [uncultured Clostridium sp.]|uniref:hypothetical protein n=1 Tax=uncultured Clostridium sp. TaxID=59620 RepID=UPI00261C06C1|nr:hypothetical protein [uncultured Clostridium sp.]
MEENNEELAEEGLLLIYRGFTSFAGLRTYEIYINDELVREINMGETYEFKLPLGTYKIKAKIDWCSSKSIDIEVKKDEVQILKIGNFKAPALITMFIPKRTIYLKKENIDLNILDLQSFKGKSFIDRTKDLDNKIIRISGRCFSVEESKNIFKNVVEFPKETNINKFALTSIRKRLIVVEIAIIFIILVLNRFNIDIALHTIIGSIVGTIILYCLFRPAIAPKK